MCFIFVNIPKHQKKCHYGVPEQLTTMNLFFNESKTIGNIVVDEINVNVKYGYSEAQKLSKLGLKECTINDPFTVFIRRFFSC